MHSIDFVRCGLCEDVPMGMLTVKRSENVLTGWVGQNDLELREEKKERERGGGGGGEELTAVNHRAGELDRRRRRRFVAVGWRERGRVKRLCSHQRAVVAVTVGRALGRRQERRHRQQHAPPFTHPAASSIRGSAGGGGAERERQQRSQT